MTRVILVRHGQTVWNVEMKYQGQTDIALTEIGVRQAECVARRLAGKPVGAIYSSDLQRAYKTAKVIAASHQLPVVPLTALREICFGEWEGMNYSAVNEQWGAVIEDLYARPEEVAIPGGESFGAVQKRTVAAIDQLLAAHPEETIIVVSHGAAIRTILCEALHIPLSHVWRIRQDNTAVNIIDYYEEMPIVTLMNDTHHLREREENP